VTHEPDYSLYLVTDPGLLAGRDPVDVVGRAIDGGVTVVQHRDKDAPDGDYLSAAAPLRALCARRGVAFIVNDRVHLVRDLGADGVHVGQKDMALAGARRLLPSGAVIGVSVSTVAEALEAEAGGATYLGVSPVFGSPMKTDAPAETGLDGLRAIRRAVTIPLVGIGSIDETNAALVVGAGADGVAVIRAILAAPDPAPAARVLREQIRKGLSSC
jgi:thiamine-phosphate pyrophosphorylase